MPVREIVTPWDRQPQEAVEIDRQNSHAAGLAICYIGNDPSRNLATGQGVVALNGATLSTGIGGIGVTRPSTSFAGSKLNTSTLLRGASGSYAGGITVLIVADPKPAATVTIPVACASGASPEWYVGFNSTKTTTASSGRFSVSTQGGNGAEVVGCIDGGLHTFGIVFPDIAFPTPSLYVDGINRTTNATQSAGPTISSSSAFDTIGGYSSSGFASTGYGIYLVLAWNRVLGPDEITSISANPWQLFQRREYIPFGSTPAPTGTRLREVVTPWDRQPQEWAEIDGAIVRSPLARIISAGSRRDLNAGVAPALDGLPRAAFQAGVGISFAGSTSERVDYDMPMSSGDMTFVAVFQPQTGAITVCGAFNISSASACAHYLSIESGNRLSVVSTESNNWTVANGPVVSYGTVYRAVAVFTAGGGRKLFVNGALVASGATARNPTGLNKFQIGLYHGGTASGYASPFKGAIGDSHLLPYALSDAEAAALSDNPWALFQRREYIPFGSTPSGTTYNQSVSGSMTAYGAILRSINKGAFGNLNLSGTQYKDTSIKRIGSLTLLANPTKLTTTSTKAGSITTTSNLVGEDSGVEFSQATSGSITLTSVLTDAVTFVRSWSSQITLSGAIAKPVSKLLSGVITLTGAVSKLITKAKFTATLTLSGIATGFGFTPGPGGGALSRGIRFMRKFIGRR